MPENTNDTTDLLKLDATIKMDDVVALKLSDVEGRLRAGDLTLQKRIAAVSKQISATEKSIVADVTQAAKLAFGPKVDAALAAFKVLLPDVYSQISGQITQTDLGDKIQAGWSINCNRCHGLGGQELIAIPGAIAEQRTALGVLVESKAKLQQQAVEIRKSMAQLPFFERQIKGQLARRRLSTTDEGKTLVDQLDNFKVAGLEQLEQLELLELPAE